MSGYRFIRLEGNPPDAKWVEYNEIPHSDAMGFPPEPPAPPPSDAIDLDGHCLDNLLYLIIRWEKTSELDFAKVYPLTKRVKEFINQLKGTK